MIMDTLFQALFAPRSIAFIGASTNVFKWGFNILHHIIRGGYAGGIYPVNPQGGEWFGRQVYTSLDRIDGPIDLAVIVVKDSLVPTPSGHARRAEFRPASSSRLVSPRPGHPARRSSARS